MADGARQYAERHKIAQRIDLDAKHLGVLRALRRAGDLPVEHIAKAAQRKPDHSRPDLSVRRGADAPYRDAQLYVCQNDRDVPESNEFFTHSLFSVLKIYLIIKHTETFFKSGI